MRAERETDGARCTKCVDDHFADAADRLVSFHRIVREGRVGRALDALKLVGGRVH